MPIVIADTGPINYLILIGQIDILPALFEKVILPVVVREELGRAKAPQSVRSWIAEPPAWVELPQNLPAHGASIEKLDAGEADAIALAIGLKADLLLMDDRDGVNAARAKGFRVAGTLGVLAMAAERNLLDLVDAFDRIKSTSFHYRQELMDQFLAEQGGKPRLV